MTDPVKMSSEPLPLMSVSIIGTKEDDIPAPGTIAVTPKTTQPNLLVNVVTPIVAILIRFANAYLTMLVGLVSAGMATDIIPVADFQALVVASAKLSLAGAGLGFLKDCVTIFGRLENRFPLLTGSI